MPGQSVIVTEERPEHVRLTLPFHFEKTMFASDAIEQRVPLFIATKDCWLQGATLRYATAAGSTVTARIAKVANGTAVSTNTDLTTASSFNMNTTADTNQSASVNTSTNYIAAGELVIFEMSGTGGNLDGVALTLELTERRQ